MAPEAWLPGEKQKKWSGLGKPLNLPEPLSGEADPAGRRGAKLQGGCKGEREPLRSAGRDVMRRPQQQ